MKKPCLLSAAVLLTAWTAFCQAQQGGTWEISGQNASSQVVSLGDTNLYSNGVLITNATAIVTANDAMQNVLSGDFVAEGDVTILDHGHIWRGTNFIYNAKNGNIRTGTFKTVSNT